MANIGSFKKVGHEYQGEIVTLQMQARSVRIVPEDSRSNDKAPSHRVYAGKAEIGAGWAETSKAGVSYLSVKLDDPSFPNPIFANLFGGESDEEFNLVWTRNCRQGGE